MRNLVAIARLLFIFAALWSLGASAYWLLSPVTIHEIRASSVAGGSQSVEELSRQASWYEVQGLWGVIVLLVFALLYGSISFFAIKDQRLALAIASLLATAFTLLSGLSIGPLYLPALLAVCVAWLILGIAGILRRREGPSG